MNSNNSFFILYHGEDDQETAIAAFSELAIIKELAGRLEKFIEGGVEIKEVSLGEYEIDVDKYAGSVKLGQTPYSILLNKDESLFEHWDTLGPDFDEPTLESESDHVAAMQKAELVNPDKQWGVGGTFWAEDVESAIIKANILRSKVFEHLNVTKML